MPRDATKPHRKFPVHPAVKETCVLFRQRNFYTRKKSRCTDSSLFPQISVFELTVFKIVARIVSVSLAVFRSRCVIRNLRSDRLMLIF